MVKKVSIVIPVYNVENYLVECLLSAVNQDYDNKEIILVDDGSTDTSDLIIEDFQSKYSFVRSVRTKNQGQSSARNTGLEMASGDYVLFLDSDDWIEKNTISMCINTIIQNNLDIVLFSGQAFVDGNTGGHVDLSKLYKRCPELIERTLTSGSFYYEELKANNLIVQPCMYMFNRNKYRDLRFYPGIIFEDNLYTTQLLLLDTSAKVMCLRDVLFHRRYRPQSTVTQKKQRRHVDGHFVVIDELTKMVSKYSGKERVALRQLITNLLFDVVLILNPVYGWHIPLKIRLKILTLYFKYGLMPFNVKLFVKFMIPGSFSFWKSLKFNSNV